MKLGFIGTGNITSDVITGICRSDLKFKQIIISPRNKKKAKKLKKKFKRVIIAKNNQEVINKSNWVFIGVLPKVANQILPNLNFREKQTVVSFVATLNLSNLKKKINCKVNLVRAIPMPPISLGLGPVIMCPPNKKVKNFFNKLGTSVEIKNEKLSNNFWAISGTMAAFYETLKILSDWLVKKKTNRKKAQEYITSLYFALAGLALENSGKNMNKFVSDSQTPGGLNWQGVNQLRKAGYYKLLKSSLDNLLKRLNKS